MATEEVGYVLAQPAKDGAVDATAVGVVGKQGHAFCGGCCDVRRAVIIVNIINVVFASLGLVTMGGLMVATSQNYDDDEVQAAMTTFNEANLSMAVLITLIAVKLVANGLGIYGAATYNIWMVGISLVVYCIDFVMGLVAANVIGLVIACVFDYPHFFFIKEVRSGIMSEANYVNEKQSCCCV
jgi:uncharacterized membrane protein